jgi:hypothetical protein
MAAPFALRLGVALAILAYTAASAQLPPPQPPMPDRLVVLRGRVVTAGDRPSPVRRATIDVIADGRTIEIVYSDSQGRFEARVPAGAPFTLAASKPGFARARLSPPLIEATPETPIDVPLTRGGVITGRLRGQQGEPVANITVRARRVTSSADAAQGAATEASAVSDDLGEFRISGLVPGSYSVGVVGWMPRAAPSSDPLTIVVPPGMLAPPSLRMLDDTPPPVDVLVDVASGREASTVFDGVVGGQVVIVADKPGAPGRRAQIASTGIAASGGVVSGTVLDEFGEPVEGVDVELRPITLHGGGGALGAAATTRRTDDLGRFRLFGVLSGTYYLAVVPALVGGASRFAPIYYPGRAALSDAFSVAVEDGQELNGLSLTFSLLSTSRVRGLVLDASGQPLSGSVVLASVLPVGVVSLPGFSSSIAADGGFELTNVPDGDYVLQATGLGASRSREFGLAHVRVTSSGAEGIVISTSPGSRLTGRVVVEGDAANRNRRSSLGISVSPADPAYTPARTVYEGGFIDAEGRFDMSGLIGPGRFALEGAPPGWWLRSVTIGGVDVTDTGVTFGADDYRDVTAVIATDGGVIEGRVTGAPMRAQFRMSVAVFPLDEGRWFYRSRHLRLVRVNPDGRYSVSGLPPGEYWIAACETTFEEGAHTSWQHPAFLMGLLPTARRVRMVDRATARLDLRLE